jgi:hypothetical protein
MLGQSLILIVDDEVDYSSLLQAALEEARVTNPFSYEELVQLAAEIRDDYLHPKPLRHAA